MYLKPDMLAVGVLLVFSSYWLWGGIMGGLDLLVGLILIWMCVGNDDDDGDYEPIYGA